MPYTKVNQNHQITLPVAVLQEIGIKEGDTLEAKIENGKIVLIPQIIRENEENEVDLLSMIGAGEHCKSFESMEEANDFIRHLRSEWKY